MNYIEMTPFVINAALQQHAKRSTAVFILDSEDWVPTLIYTPAEREMVSISIPRQQWLTRLPGAALALFGGAIEYPLVERGSPLVVDIERNVNLARGVDGVVSILARKRREVES